MKGITMTNYVHPLVGKTIRALYLTEDKLAIKFVTQEGEEIIAKADADCCSNTWIEHISLPYKGFPATVLDTQDLDIPDNSYDNQEGTLIHYGFKIVTDCGDIVLDYRNESNGYYGGSLCWDDKHFYGGVYDQQISKNVWIEVTKDI